MCLVFRSAGAGLDVGCWLEQGWSYHAAGVRMRDRRVVASWAADEMVIQRAPMYEQVAICDLFPLAGSL